MKRKPKKKPLSTFRERVAGELGKGKTGVDAVQAVHPDTSPEAAAVTASRMMQDERVRARVHQHIKAQTDCTAEEVIGTLVAQMRGDPTDCLREDGTFDFERVCQLGLGHLIKKLTQRQTVQEIIPVETGEGEVAPKTTTVLRVDFVTVEFHSSQGAAIQLCRVFGIEQQARENERDAKIRLRVAAALERLAKKYFKGDLGQAKTAYLTGAPSHSKYLM